MGIGNIGIPSLLLMFTIALFLFGPGKLPELGKAVGQTIQEFKKTASQLFTDQDDNPKQD